MSRQRVRIRFRKEGDLRLISHRDLMRSMDRLFRRAEIQLAMSQGFRPKPKISFPLALAVGVAGRDEVMELELADTWEDEQLARTLEKHAPPGLEFTSVETIAPQEAKAQVVRVTYEIDASSIPQAELQAAIERFLKESEYWIVREDNQKKVDLRAPVQSLGLEDSMLKMIFKVSRQGTARPREILAAIGLDSLEQTGIFLTRTEVELEKAHA
ncbi:Radical SAM-linked protein [Planctomycetales bacterium 10988]|nr:Radical SAM-linked protein [Planctomycetales bacterium 10988]